MVEVAAARVEAVQRVTGNVAVIKHLLGRVPERRLAEQRRRGHGDAHTRVGRGVGGGLQRHHSTAMSSFIEASKVSPGARLRSPWAAGSAMWIAFETWLTGSTQK